MTTPEELDALQERLTERDKTKHGFYGYVLFNRDGPEAAAAITDLRARVAELEEFIENDADWKFSAKRRLALFREQRARAEKAEAELAALHASAGVRVTPLAWKHYKPDDTYPEAWCADCIGGFYTVIKDGPRAFRWLNTEGREFDGETSEVGAKAAAQADYEARIRAALVSPGDGWRRCDGYRAVGAIHCAHPDECGNMKHVNVADLIAQADSWQSWLDDLPLPDDFREGINDCQQYIADLSYALQPQPAPPASEGADHG